MSRLLMFMIVVLWFQNASAASWLCTPMASTGFVIPNGITSATAEILLPGSPIVIREMKDSDPPVRIRDQEALYVAFAPGEQEPLAHFFADLEDIPLWASSNSGRVTINFNPNKRIFTMISDHDFMLYGSAAIYEPFMSIGGCTEL